MEITVSPEIPTRTPTRNTLIVTAHPDTGSVTHQVARRLSELLESHESSFAHLAQEGFDPRFTAADRRAYVAKGEPEPAIAAEQSRFEGVDHVVLVFPVYWWSMPALLKGWIDRVFVTGWAFDFDSADRLVPQLGRLTLHLLPVSGTKQEAFSRHGYGTSMSTQIEHGIVDFCGMQRGATAFVYDSESGSEDVVARDMEIAATAVASAIQRHIP
jgi:NAD(P)H dehydrogenase (quinone)